MAVLYSTTDNKTARYCTKCGRPVPKGRPAIQNPTGGMCQTCLRVCPACGGAKEPKARHCQPCSASARREAAKAPGSLLRLKSHCQGGVQRSCGLDPRTWPASLPHRHCACGNPMAAHWHPGRVVEPEWSDEAPTHQHGECGMCVARAMGAYHNLSTSEQSTRGITVLAQLAERVWHPKS